MTVDEFLAWSQTVPGRHELVAGEVVAMAPERARHAEAKAAVYTSLRQALRDAGLSCRVLPDGMTVRIDGHTAYEPDAIVYCGPRIDPETVEVPEPLIVVEVLSPGTKRIDTGEKLVGYFRVPSIVHYLVVDPVRALVIHYRRAGERIETAIVAQGSLHLDPPGLRISLADLFENA
ncbi:Uma2 family endonuclease [Methylobacterium oryzihabitans]|uniref:Uma2 family endonuclease n=1 Tax=Methylobacterium oryzihabitans TaxID=2499852 RepID=A0A437PE80_9HYPH|nr:Uma2 family endonuclease [Methylobacterium oryzihabitans]RVU20557.1 Uma2 family endonuclease [Methylobacterium oryzihabitans]